MSNNIVRKVIGNLKLIMKTYFYDKNEIDTALLSKADVSSLNSKADTSNVNSALAEKADLSSVNESLSQKSDNTHTHDGRYPLTETVNSQITGLNNRIDGLVGLRAVFVEELPDIEDAEEQVVYCVRNENISGANLYDEYVFSNNRFEQFGSSEVNVDLSDYATISFVNTSLQGYVDTNSFNTYKNEISLALGNKADKTTATTSTDGLMSKEDKAKFDSLSSVLITAHLSNGGVISYSSED